MKGAAQQPIMNPSVSYRGLGFGAGDEMAEKIQIMGSTPVEEEPLYGLTYLPRKFKAGRLE